MIVTFATTVMNREEDLKVTLPINMELLSKYPNTRLLILNYNSKGDTREVIGGYINNPQLLYFEERTAEYFSMAKSKNIALVLSEGLVVNLDADNFLDVKYIEEVFRLINIGVEIMNPVLRIEHLNCGSGGRLACSKKILLECRGYDESMTGWGTEDIDLIERLNKYPNELRNRIVIEDDILPIKQSSEQKMVNYHPSCGNKAEPNISNLELLEDVNREINPNGIARVIVYDKNNKQYNTTKLWD